MNARPSNAMAPPTGRKSNIAKPCPASDCARKPETIRFGGVPISVVMPPRIVAKASGISIRPGVVPSRPDIRTASGIRSASAPTLFITDDSPAPSPSTADMLPIRPACAGTTRRARRSIAPEVWSDRLSTSTQATVMTAPFANPSNAPCAGTTPPATPARSAASATMSCRNRPQTNSATVAARIARMM